RNAKLLKILQTPPMLFSPRAWAVYKFGGMRGLWEFYIPSRKMLGSTRDRITLWRLLNRVRKIFEILVEQTRILEEPLLIWDDVEFEISDLDEPAGCPRGSEAKPLLPDHIATGTGTVFHSQSIAQP